jgi:transposase
MTMTRTKDTTVLSVIHEVCCGLDIHKESISACMIFSDEHGNMRTEYQEFDAFTDELIRLRTWLVDYECPIVAMESTGIYWRPLHNVLEGHVEVILVNARHVKNVPGRKTDMSDSQWLAGLLRVGLLKGSFIPPKEVRHWRDLSRYRRALVKRSGDAKRRTHKLLESANIKIDSVASQLFGVTARNLMNLLVKDDAELTESDVEFCLKGSLKSKGAELFRAVKGYIEDHHRWLLNEMLQEVDQLEEQISRVNARLRSMLSDNEDLIDRLDEVPGISFVSAYAIIAEVGPTLETFDTAAALCSWAGVCPGNNQSAGKRLTGKIRVRKRHIKTILTEVAWAGIKEKQSYYRAKYFSLRSRLGPKKAITAIAHRILKAVYHIIKHGATFKELGEDYLLNLNKSSKLNYLSRQAQKLGFILVSAPK